MFLCNKTMFTCRTCKLLKHSQAKRDIFRDEDGTFLGYKCEANSIIDALSEWYCLTTGGILDRQLILAVSIGII